jgi:hypothetical protein
VEDVLGFLAGRVLELEDGLDAPDPDGEAPRIRAELEMTSDLIDQVLHLYHELGADEIERLEAAAQASA